MGQSHSGRHANGPQVFGADAIWPREWRTRWSELRSEAERRFAAPPRFDVLGSKGRSLRSVLQEAGLHGTLRRLAARHRVDEAHVARLWARCDGGDPRRTASLVRQRLRLVRALEESMVAAARSSRLRVPTATRNHLRTLALTAALSLEDVPSTVEAVRRFVRAALPDRIP